jgi:hypothetical protein
MKHLSVLLAVLVGVAPIEVTATTAEGQPMTLDELRERYPDARFVEVEPETYVRMVSQLPAAEIVPMKGQTNAPPSEARFQEATLEESPVGQAPVAEPDAEGAEVPPARQYHPGDAVVVGAGQVYGGPASRTTTCIPWVDVSGAGQGSISSGDLATIIYVVIGVVVVGAALIYAGVIAYDLIVSGHDVPGWTVLAVSAWSFGGSGRRGGMYGGRFGGGFVGDHARVGLLLEGGYLDGRVRLRDRENLYNVYGAYGLFGPTVQWRLTDGPKPLTLDADLLTGYSTADGLGLISRATLGLSWPIGQHLRAGVAGGSTYMRIRETEGVLNTKSDFNFTGGGWIGMAL